jgi:hypothetical protein
MQNKAKLGRPGISGGRRAGEPIVRHRLDAPLRETNPIWPRGTGTPSASLSGRALPVDPNHGRDAHATLCRSGDRRSREGKLCETKPIPGEPGCRSRSIAPNKPNFGPACGGGISTIPLFQYSNPMPILRHRLDAPLRETNPICPAGRDLRDRDRGGNRAKQSQFPPEQREG